MLCNWLKIPNFNWKVFFMMEKKLVLVEKGGGGNLSNCHLVFKIT